jgi:Glyoxalase-like domain
MTALQPILDHVVIDVRDQMDEAVATYRNLGFHLTPRGHHTLGTINHLAVFDTDYLELLGFEKGATQLRTDVLRFPAGLNGLVFGTEDSACAYERMTSNGLPAHEPVAFSRPVDLADGRREDASFRTVRLDPDTVPSGRVYFCHHLTRHLVWRDEWQRHANGAKSIVKMTIAAQNQQVTATVFERMFGAAALHCDGESAALTAANARIELITPDALIRRFGDAAPQPLGRKEYMAALTFRVVSLEQTARALHNIDRVRSEPDRLIVPADAACNVTLEFMA